MNRSRSTHSLAPIDARLPDLGEGVDRPGLHSLADVLDSSGLPAESVAKIWRSLGRPGLDPERTTFSEADLRMFELTSMLAGGDRDRDEPRGHEGPGDESFDRLVERGDGSLRPVLRTLRAATQALRRVSDAHVTAKLEQLSADDGHDLIDDVGLDTDVVEELLVELWRHELRQSVARALALTDNPTTPLLAVGFVDLADYSARSQHLATDDLVELVDRFDSAALEIVADHGASLVKTIGDEIMFVHPDPTMAARVALDLLDRCATDDLMLAARAGLSWGRPLTVGGDYYGPSVNLAARLVQLARPGTALVDGSLAARLDVDPDFELGPMRPQRLRNCGTHDVHSLRRPAATARRHRVAAHTDLLTVAGDHHEATPGR